MGPAKPLSRPQARSSCRWSKSTIARSAPALPDRLQGRCGRASTVTPNGLDRLNPGQSQLLLARCGDVACNSRPKPWSNPTGGQGLAIISREGAREQITDNDNGGRPLTKSARHLPESRTPEQHPTDHLSCELAKADRRGNM